MTTRSGLLFADILVADRSPEVVRALRVLLQSAGYIVRSAQSEEEVLQTVLAQPPDLILLDAALGGDGSHQLVRQLKARERLPFIPIILLKSVAGQEDIATALNAGADEIIARPIDNAELLMRIRAMLRLKVATDELRELNQTLEQKVIERTRALEEAHARLRHAEKLSALGRMAASIAHEINNPLTAILGHIFLLKEALDEGSPLREDVAVIEQEVDAIARLVRQLRDVSKPPQKERRLIDLNAVADSTLNLLSKELQKHRIQIVRQFEPALPPVLASPDQMGEVFMNLIINAQDAMPEGGTLTVRTSTVDGWVEASVSDTGVGIEPELLDRILEPFFTTKGERGTGLGLAICHSILHDHGGEISVESQVGKGTTFTIHLPRADAGG